MQKIIDIYARPYGDVDKSDVKAIVNSVLDIAKDKIINLKDKESKIFDASGGMDEESEMKVRSYDHTLKVLQSYKL